MIGGGMYSHGPPGMYGQGPPGGMGGRLSRQQARGTGDRICRWCGKKNCHKDHF